jgi:hypothetical protein
VDAGGSDIFNPGRIAAFQADFENLKTVTDIVSELNPIVAGFNITQGKTSTGRDLDWLDYSLAAAPFIGRVKGIRHLRYLDELAEVTPRPMAGSVRTVNPLFPSFGYNQNCVNCAITTEKRFRGIKVSAAPTAGPLPISAIADEFGGSFQDVSGMIEISRVLRESGEGARGIVFGADHARGFGHVWNARIDKGVIRFIDGQSGGLGVSNFDDFTDFRFLLTHPGR